MYEPLESTEHKLVDIEGLQDKLDRFNAKTIGLEAKVIGLKAKMTETKEINIAEFKEFDAYKLEFNMIATQFFAKERLKMK